MSHPKLLAALMDLDTGLRTQKILGDDFLVTEILTGAFFFTNNSQIWGGKSKKYNP